MTDLKYRPAEYERMRGVRVMRRIQRHRAAKDDPSKTILPNGSIITRREVTAQCETCPAVFTFTMTTKRHRFCPACKVQRARDHDAGRRR